MLRYRARRSPSLAHRLHSDCNRMQDRFAPAIAANRFGLGARPGELASIGGDPRGWLIAQLKGGAPQMAETGLRTSQDILAETIELRREQREMRKAKIAAPSADDASHVARRAGF